jgi:hypothetical protein
VLGENRTQYPPCALISKQPLLVVRLLHTVREAFRTGQEFFQRFVKFTGCDDLGERLCWRIGDRCEIGVQERLELVLLDVIIGIEPIGIQGRRVNLD